MLTMVLIRTKTAKISHRINRTAMGPRVQSGMFGVRSTSSPGRCSDSHVWIKEPVMKSLVSRFVKDESGATALEYGLIAAGISVAIITVVQGLGTKLFNNFDFVEKKLQNPT